MISALLLQWWQSSAKLRGIKCGLLSETCDAILCCHSSAFKVPIMKREVNSNAHKDKETLKLEGERGERRRVVRAQASCECTGHKTVWPTNIFGEKSQTLLGFTFHNKSPFLLLKRVSRTFRDFMFLPMNLSQLVKKHAAKCWRGQAYLPKLPSPAYAVTTTYDTMGCHQHHVWIMEQPEAISDGNSQQHNMLWLTHAQ